MEVCTRARRRPRHRLHDRGLRPDRQGGHRRPRRRRRSTTRSAATCSTSRTKCIAFEGRLVVVGFTSGRIPEAPANHLLVKNYSVVGLHWGLYRKYEPGDLRAGARASWSSWSRPAPSTRWSARCTRWPRPRGADEARRRGTPSARSCWSPEPSARAHLRADCARCAGLCCVAPAFAALGGLRDRQARRRAVPQPAASDFRCGIHAELRRARLPRLHGLRLLRRRPAGHAGHVRRPDWRDDPGLARRCSPCSR